jgi:hypothetical protein
MGLLNVVQPCDFRAESGGAGGRGASPSSRSPGTRSYSVASLQPSCCFPCSMVGGAGTVAFQHGVRPPAHQPLEITFLAAGQ